MDLTLFTDWIGSHSNRYYYIRGAIWGFVLASLFWSLFIPWLKRHLISASICPDKADTCYVCGETEGYHEKYCSRGTKSRG